MRRTRRNQYRKPSALGVPNAKFEDDRESNNYKGVGDGERAKAKRYDDNLKSEGLDFNADSENRNQYKVSNTHFAVAVAITIDT